MMFETSDKHIAVARVASPSLTSTPSQFTQIEEREADIKRQEQELLVSKDKVFTKWQEYLEKSEQIEARESEVKHLMEELRVKEGELEQKSL